VEGGILTGSRIVEQGGGPDQPYLKGFQAHRRHFDRAPDLLAADRGMSSAANERLARRSGVR